MVPSPPVHRHARTSAVALCVTLSVMLGACGSHGADAVGTEVGTIQLALTALGSDGATYRLRRGTLDIQGPTPSSVDLGKLSSNDVAFQSKVNVGKYTITLMDGWTLQRADGEHYVDVSAELLSTNPAIVDVQPDEVAVVSVLLQTVDAEVEFATGGLDVWLSVKHLDCEHGDFITRSCGANLTGSKFRVCDSGWWKDWSECGTHCNRGYCHFTQPESFDSATVNHSVEALDFTRDAHGSWVDFDFYGPVHGDTFSHHVSFQSVGVSNQSFPWDSGTPFVGQSHEDVALHSFTEADQRAVIGSSAGVHNHAFFDGLEASLPVDSSTHALTMVVQGSEAGYTVSLRDESAQVLAELAIPPSAVSDAEQRITIIGDPIYYGVKGASSVVITPRPSTSTPLGTTSWSMNEFAFAR